MGVPPNKQQCDAGLYHHALVLYNCKRRSPQLRLLSGGLPFPPTDFHEGENKKTALFFVSYQALWFYSHQRNWAAEWVIQFAEGKGVSLLKLGWQCAISVRIPEEEGFLININ